MDIKKEIESYRHELISLRRDFHVHPELGFEEYRTSQVIADYLQECGLEVSTGIAQTGVVGLLKGTKPGPTVLLRADMDALPIQEENDIAYKSVYDNKMHACGHDGHMAMLLVTAKIMARYKNRIKGNIKFIFQPNEEDAGAQIMIEEGILEAPLVDAALGIHLWSSIETGKIGIVSGPVMASSYYFKLVIQGKGGHGGAPHKSIDPVSCAVNIMQTVQTMQTKEINALKPTVITFCKINCGSSPIIIPERIEIEGSIRCLYDGTEEIQKRFEQVVKGLCEVHRTSYELDFKCGNTLLSNDFEITELVKKAAIEVVGEENIINSNISTMLGEDFAEISTKVPSTFYFVGTANKETDYPHHHPRFNIDEDALQIGVEMHIRCVLEYLNKNNELIEKM